MRIKRYEVFNGFLAGGGWEEQHNIKATMVAHEVPQLFCDAKTKDPGAFRSS